MEVEGSSPSGPANNMENKILIFTATYNESENITEFLDLIDQLQLDLDVLIVDDNSPDGTSKKIQEYKKNKKNIELVIREKKEGINTAHKFAYTYAKQNNYSFLITLDADLSHDPKRIPGFLEELKTNTFVIGSRYIEGGKCEMKPFRFFLPKQMKEMIELMPRSFPSKKLRKMKIYPASNRKKTIARVALLTGCVQKIISPQINESTIRLLNRHGIEVVVSKGIECCGSLNHHLGKTNLSNQTFKKNILIWYEEYLKNGLDAIISNTSGCGTTLKDYGFIFRDDNDLKKKARKISELTKDITEYLDNKVKLNFISKMINEKKYRIAYHSACSMQHGQKVHKEPINLIKKTGNEVFEIPDGHLCCGSAGTYNLLQNNIAKRLLKNKIENINKIKPQFISTGNIGCIIQIGQETKIPILHTIEIIDWYTGGPKPEILKNL